MGAGRARARLCLGGRQGRARWLALFVALLLAISATPVLAAEPSEEQPPPTTSTPDDPERYFDAQVVPVDLGAVEGEEAEREEWLQSAAALQQREASWALYADLSPAESEALLHSVFAEQLATLNDDPARFLSDAQLVRPLDETAAAVKDDGERSLLDAPMPVRTEDEDGDLAKVDLTLEPTAQGYETANALSDLTLAPTAAGEMELGEEGFAISQTGADSAARRFGDKNLFYPEVLPDTDLLVAGTASGMELFDLLRSEASPEDFHFEIDVPDGATLRSDGFGGAEVVREGEILNRIAAPSAIDAQGSEVPVELTVAEGAVALHVEHRGGDFAAPILLDPIVEDWVNNSWYAGWSLQSREALYNGAWKYATNNPKIYGNPHCTRTCWGSGYGLHLATEGNVFYGPEQFGQWSYSTANSKTYIKAAWISPFWRQDYNCGSSAQPHDYAGMLWEPGQIWNPVVANQAKTGALSIGGNGHAFIVGIGTGPPGVWIQCWREVYAGGVALWIDDEWGPVVNSLTGAPSSEWIGDTTPVNLSVNASDEGLGIYRATITPGGKGAISKLLGCTGLYGNRCPTSTGVGFKLTGLSFGEGVRSAGVLAEDPTGKIGAGSPFQTKVDRTPPEVTLSGQLAQATNEGGGAEQPPGEGDELSLPVYSLKIEATDGSNDTNLTRRSGVKDIEVLLDGVECSVPWSAQSPTEDSRPMTQGYQLELSTLQTAGKHTLEVKVKDQVGNLRERKIEFEYFPATGIKDEYAMHYFPLPDGSGEEAAEEHPDRPELAVNAMNGNLLYREQDVEVEGAALDLEVERYYNSQLPENQSTEWGDGWTLAQTPDLEPLDTGGSPVPDRAGLRDSSGAIEDGVELPAQAGQSRFDPALRATLTKRTSGGYELTDATGESATSVAFDEDGRTEALLTDGYARVDYDYEGGELAAIEVSDPATFAAADPSQLGGPEPPELTDGDPEVAVETSDGLVAGLSGEEAGEHSYGYEGDFLVSHDGPKGETEYEKSAAGLLSKVTLPNGTWAQIEYFADNRVKSVTVAPEGANPKTTAFQYTDAPTRRTVVIPADAPHVTYDIGEDGSVLKWWNAEQPPVFDDLAGSLYEFREEEGALAPGDHYLDIQAHSEEGIASIQVIANGDQLVHETPCDQPQVIECKTLLSEWVTNTELNAPGHLSLEVLIADRFGHTAAERFWVDIPEPPPPPAPGTPIPPKFEDILEFREEFGLEKVFPVANEIERNERIFDLINAWYEGDPVARASAEKWGVPLRPADVAELEWRQAVLVHDGPLIAKWGEANFPAAYAGYYMDHRAGGKIRVGFISDMATHVAELGEAPGIVAPDRLTPFASEPTQSLLDLRDAAASFRQQVSTHPEITNLLTTSGMDIQGNRLTIGATSTVPVAQFVTQHLGVSPAINLVFDANKPIANSNEENPRERALNSRLFAGDRISSGCTLAFGAWESNVNPNTGAPVIRNFALAAGHCNALGEEVSQLGEEWLPPPNGFVAEEIKGPVFGHVSRNSYGVNQAGFDTDIEAIRMDGKTEVPRWIYWSPGAQSKINGEAEFVPGGILCHSANSTGVQCGVAESEPVEIYYAGGSLPHWMIKVNMLAERGDSGAPVIDPITGAAVGIHGGSEEHNIGSPSPISYVVPLMPLEGKDRPEIPAGTAPGLDAAPLASRLHIVDCCK